MSAQTTIPHEVTTPQAVMEATYLGDGMSHICAWREYLGLTQENVAERMGITRAAYAQMEAKDAKPRPTTLKKIAEAMGVNWRQLQA